jgi:peptidoglycan/LPS O-acetylase OafA/YrhL
MGESKLGAMQNKTRNQAIDALRGLAASFVILWHFCTYFFMIYPEFPNPNLSFPNGAWAVWLFFGISGYVIPMTVARITNPLDFVKARAARLYPTFLVSVVFTYAIVNMFGTRDLGRTFKEMLVNLTMIANALGYRYIDKAYWSLEAEWFFYLIIFLVLTFRLREKMQYVSASMLIPLLISKHIGALNPQLSTAVSRLGILENIHFFVPGICLYHWNRDKNRIFLWIIGAFLIIQARMRGIEGGAICAVIIVLLYGASNGRLRWLESRPLLFLGTISYSLYLVHQHIGYALMIQLLKRGVNPYVTILTVIPIVVLMAMILTFFVERPSMSWYKKVQASREMKRRSLVGENI